MKDITPTSDLLNEAIKKFIENDCNPLHSRETTFDLCYKYFHQNRGRLHEDIEKSCCLLWSYLASWGMLRGSTLLIKKNPAYLVELIEYINSEDCKDIFDVDMDTYDNGGIEEIIRVYHIIEDILSHNETNRKPTATLVTKIMLGVFGCVPAYDQYFCKEFNRLKPRKGFSSYRVDKISLSAISEFYKSNKADIDSQAEANKIVDIFSTNTDPRTSLKYTKAKIIDMYGFSAGLSD